jgi:mannose-6-phosphate isomerase-like protein (cupin superfamily)
LSQNQRICRNSSEANPESKSQTTRDRYQVKPPIYAKTMLGVQAYKMIRTTEMNSRLLEDLPVVRLPKFVPPGGGLSIWWMGDDRITFQAISSDTAGAYAFWVDEPPGHVGPPKHVHSREEEGFYVIEGQVEFRAGHIGEVLTKDTFIALPKGIPHSWINTTTGHAKLITFTAGAGNEGFFLTLGAPGVGPAGPRATLPLWEINARTQRYGVTYMENHR